MMPRCVKLADGLFNRQNLPSQILLQLAGLYARHDDTAKHGGQLIERLAKWL